MPNSAAQLQGRSHGKAVKVMLLNTYESLAEAVLRSTFY